MDTMLIVFLIGILCVLVGVLIFIQLRKPETSNDVSTPLQNLTQAIHDVRVQTASLDASLRSRLDVENRTADSISRLETIIAGSGSKGAAGERVLENLISKLPSEWQVQNFRVGNKPVEFGLKLSNGLILPIDSKWAATDLLEQYSISNEPNEQKKLQEQIEKIVLSKAKEVQKYIEPNITTSFGVAVIPDAVYDICPTVNIETRKHRVVVVSYSMFLPYLLLVFDTVLRTSRTVDMERLNASIQKVNKGLSDIGEELEGRYSKAITMLEMSKRDLKGYVSKANSALVSAHISSGEQIVSKLENSD